MNPSTFINTSTKLMLEAQCMDLFDQTSPKLIGHCQPLNHLQVLEKPSQI